MKNPIVKIQPKMTLNGSIAQPLRPADVERLDWYMDTLNLREKKILASCTSAEPSRIQALLSNILADRRALKESKKIVIDSVKGDDAT